eukprot:UN03834
MEHPIEARNGNSSSIEQVQASKERQSSPSRRMVRSSEQGFGGAVLTALSGRIEEGGHGRRNRGKGIKPTYFETNSFTSIFQVLIDTYGVPRNGEFNPAVPSIVTFPFLFAMMYGDIFPRLLPFSLEAAFLDD